MEGNRRKPRRSTVHEEVCGVQDRRKRKDRKKGKAALKKKAEGEEHLEISGIREVKRRDWDEHVLTRHNGLRENAQAAISCRGPGPAKNKRYLRVYQ